MLSTFLHHEQSQKKKEYTALIWHLLDNLSSHFCCVFSWLQGGRRDIYRICKFCQLLVFEAIIAVVSIKKLASSAVRLVARLGSELETFIVRFQKCFSAVSCRDAIVPIDHYCNGSSKLFRLLVRLGHDIHDLNVVFVFFLPRGKQRFD